MRLETLWRQSQKTTCCMSETSPSAVILEPKKRKDCYWSWSSNTLAMWCKQLTHWERPCCWERLRAEGEEGNGGWECWMASTIQWTWTWANSGRSWGTGMPGVLQSMQSESWTWLSNWTTVWKVQNRQIYLESKYTSGCLGLEGEDGSDADG